MLYPDKKSPRIFFDRRGFIVTSETARQMKRPYMGRYTDYTDKAYPPRKKKAK